MRRLLTILCSLVFTQAHTITQCSSGIGYELALAALRRGDRVIATTRERSFPQLQADSELKKFDAQVAVLKLDVTAPLNELKVCAEKAAGLWGRVDVVVNNAGEFEDPLVAGIMILRGWFLSGALIAVGALEEVTYVSV